MYLTVVDSIECLHEEKTRMACQIFLIASYLMGKEKRIWIENKMEERVFTKGKRIT